jgi:hypothetical protein
VETIKKLLSYLTPKMRVKFSLYCALDVACNLDEKTKGPALAAIELVEKWLKDPIKVSRTELEIAAYSAHSARMQRN